MKVLLADDSEAMRTVFRIVLQKLGHSPSSIVEAKDAREATAALRNADAPVTYCVADWDLPGLDGMGLMGQLKTLGLIGKVGVLFSISRQQRSLLPQAARVGACESIERPFTEESFEAKVRRLDWTPGGKKAPESSNRVRPLPPLEPDSSMPFLIRLPSALIDDILKLSEQRQHEAGTILLRAGKVCDALHIVTRGEVEVLAGNPGRRVRVVGEGDPYGEFSFMMSEPSAYTARALSAVLTASLSKQRMSDLLRKHPVLDNHLSSLMSRHKEVLTARATTIVQSDFKGTFDTMPFPNVLQTLNIGRKTGVLGIRDDDHSGGIYLENGEAVHAWTDDMKGAEAFYELSTFTKARFAFNSIQRQEQRTLHLPTLTLLMEAMRRQEEKPAPPAASEDLGLDALFGSQ